MAKFKLECECGCNFYHVVRGLEDDTVSINCEVCGKCLATVNRFSIDWLKEDEQSAEAVD